MDDAPYSNREINEKFSHIEEKLDEQNAAKMDLIRRTHDDTMAAIGIVRVQTTATNGRVRWQEKMIYLAIGGIVVLSATILPAVGWLFTQTVHNTAQVSAVIAQLRK